MNSSIAHYSTAANRILIVGVRGLQYAECRLSTKKMWNAVSQSERSLHMLFWLT